MPRFGALPAIKGMVTLKIRYIISIGGPTILQGNGHASILKCTLPCNGLNNHNKEPYKKTFKNGKKIGLFATQGWMGIGLYIGLHEHRARHT